MSLQRRIKEITAGEIGTLGENLLLIDIRSKIAFDHGHIPGAISFPEPLEKDMKIEELEEIISNTLCHPVVLYCNIGERSRRMVEKLQQAGKDAYNLQGGYREWLIQNTDVFSREEREQYSRQMVLPQIGQVGQEKLRAASVLVIGAGALGTVALTYLASAGVGTIGIVEGDVIERSNLHRQTLYGASDIGRKKVDVAKERLELMNAFINIIPYDMFVTPGNIKGLIKDYDFVIDATDHIETKFLINDACVLAKVPFCHAGILAFEGQVMTWVPGDFPCYRCIFEDIPEDHVPNCAEAGILGAMPGMIGSVQALEAIKYITSAGELLVGKMFHIDGTNMTTRIIPFEKKNIWCKVCGENREITDVSEYGLGYQKRDCAIMHG